MKKTLFIVLDGLADNTPKTPLQLAEKHNLNFLAKQGITGLIDNEISGLDFSESANFHLLGYKEFPGRGYIEALGIGLNPKENDVCFRCNFGTVSKGIVLDRRAGREEFGLNELAEKINKIKIKNCKITFKRSLGHRAVLILRDNLNENISYTDPMELGEKIKTSKPTLPKSHSNFPSALRTAKILNEFTEESYKILSKDSINEKRKIAANIILSRYAAKKKKIKSFKEKYNLNAVCISAVGATLGLGRVLGMDTIRIGSGLTNTDLKLKLSTALNSLEKYDFVFLHIKGTDVASHDKDPREKKKFIQRIDKQLIKILLGLRNTIIVLTADHITSSEDGEHKQGYVPIVIYGSEKDEVEEFDEESVKSGGLGILHASDLMEKILSLK